MRWNLSNIYPSFDSESFKNDLQRIDKELSGFLNWMDENLINEGNGLEAKLEYVINKLNELSLLAGKLYNYASLTLSANANDETAAKYLDIIRSKFVNLSLARTKLRKFLKNVEIDFSNLKSETLKSHKFFIEEQKILSKYLLSENEEKIISLMRLTGGNAWNNLYEKTTSNLLCEVEINGELKKLPLMRVRNMAYDESAEIRKKAYEAELKACENASQVVAQCLNSIKGEFLTEVNLRGYSSPLEPMLMENRISKETFDAMMSAVKGSMPILRKYLRKKAELLGHKNGLPWYDLFAPIGGYNKKWSFDEARKFIVEKLSNFSDELGKFIDNAFENHWIDAETRPGKRGGAFCSSVKALKESRILMSFDGTLDNVLTLAHELGHAFHNYCLKDETPLNSTTPATLAETASIFNETLLMNQIKNEATLKDEKLALLDKELSDAVQIIIDIYSRFLFESEVFERRKSRPISVEEFKEIMLKAQKEAYGEGLDENYMHPYMWLVKPHYYSPTFHFYNFPYTFGMLFGLGVYSMKDNPNFFEMYKKLLSSTGKGTAEEVAMSVGIDIQKEEFWKNSLSVIEKAVDEFVRFE
ncbi:M3 family oligoendopeptidase [Fervidobacterium nodosum]|uniref:Oligoendopeptidase, pepF/M3 family n=1 Tax=Fervidobacterium nodosum (strain ATCC 35602 / DSM 5306 / Rt17-B1) TaxID=381764 RepID=A7HMC6_FERNB|nr:M3 family oligoendopeptidase [Fervidobacterium nodosum]ABS61059.1 oligoendopeptidase, pepF/M3 family [Fervidobacterium nodosum Rt17-B1]PHJ12927.1 peptidase M3 [Fervidobacterium sp. SC_NGM5_G05]